LRRRRIHRIETIPVSCSTSTRPPYPSADVARGVATEFPALAGHARSRHPLSSLAANGPLASDLVGGNLRGEEPLPHGRDSGYHRFCEMGGRVISLGVPLVKVLTVLHVAEEVRDDSWPVGGFFYRRRFDVEDESGQRHETTVRERRPEFVRALLLRRVRRDLIAHGILSEGQVGGVQADVVEGQALWISCKRNRGLRPIPIGIPSSPGSAELHGPHFERFPPPAREEPMPSIMYRVNKVFRETLGIADLVLTAATAPGDLREWDSVAHVQLFLALESEFDTSLTPEELASITRVGDILSRFASAASPMPEVHGRAHTGNPAESRTRRPRAGYRRRCRRHDRSGGARLRPCGAAICG
jgi:acyl carrier protein